jgi:hypothetical protein
MVMERKLADLVRDRKWQEVVELCSRGASQHHSYEGSFKFWYSKALGECALLRIEECRESFLNAGLHAQDRHRSSIQKMQQFLDIFGNPAAEQRRTSGSEALLV